jgi:hypothetical protein
MHDGDRDGGRGGTRDGLKRGSRWQAYVYLRSDWRRASLSRIICNNRRRRASPPDGLVVAVVDLRRFGANLITVLIMST